MRIELSRSGVVNLKHETSTRQGTRNESSHKLADLRSTFTFYKQSLRNALKVPELIWWIERWETRANDKDADSNLASIASAGTEESIFSNIVPEGPPDLFAQPNQRVGLLSRYCEKCCVQRTASVSRLLTSRITHVY
jgi:hypothetical protein